MSKPAKDEIRYEPTQKRIRAYLAGELVADTRNALLVWEVPYYPTYYLPASDFTAELVPTGQHASRAGLGRAEVFSVKVAAATAEHVARQFTEAPAEALRTAVRLDWAAMTEWLEEDEPVYTHPRDPHTRVDVLGSSRHVRIELDGVTVADSRQPRILFETGLPPRYYLPLSDVRTELLRPSDTTTHCPYKGTAGYWSVDTGKGVHTDVVWIYRTPLPESQKITGLACFYDEKAEVYVDGELQQRPATKFS